MKIQLIRISQFFSIALIGVMVIILFETMAGGTAAHALPEFAENTGQPCATCHVNPGGGGPRTLRGLLWAAKGRPDEVPDIGNILIALGVTDGVELYDIACSACHGVSGEGLFGGALVSSGLSENNIRDTILRGKERSGMPSFNNRFTEEQLKALVRYTAGIASGSIEPAPISYPLPAGELDCRNNETSEKCGGN
jgi:mono/diheme cytochrome c family protein